MEADHIENCISSSLVGKLSSNPIIIKLDDPLMNKDIYERLLNKFYAVMRYKLYQNIKTYWDCN